MAKPLVFRCAGAVITAEIGAKVDKQVLYGHAKKVVEREGRALRRGFLAPDGALIRGESASLAKADPQGSPVEDVKTEIQGQTPELLPSSFDRESDLESVPLITLVGFNARDAYPLTLTGLAPGLYRTQFAYRKAYQYQDALLLVKEGEAWLFVGQFKLSTHLGQTVVYDFFDAATEDATETEDLDFAMV